MTNDTNSKLNLFCLPADTKVVATARELRCLFHTAQEEAVEMYEAEERGDEDAMHEIDHRPVFINGRVL